MTNKNVIFDLIMRVSDKEVRSEALEGLVRHELYNHPLRSNNPVVSAIFTVASAIDEEREEHNTKGDIIDELVESIERGLSKISLGRMEE